jgi:thiosulfate dehydrogenase [quinone] large subunit
MSQHIEIAEPPISRFLFANTKMAWFWLIVRVYVGYEWMVAGWQKVQSPAWVGENAGAATTGFLKGALNKTSGAHPDVQGWYASFIENVALPNAEVLSYLVAYGELIVGIALILGIFTGIAAFFGSFMNLNFLLAGTVSVNPILLILQLFLILAWRTAGWIGLDRYLLSKLGTPWQLGSMFKK